MEDYRVPVRPADRVRAGLAVQMVALATGLTPEDIASERHQPPATCRARHVAMYLSHIAFGWPMERVGHAFGRNRSSVGSACRWVEDRRSNPGLDRMLNDLERALRFACAAPRCEPPALGVLIGEEPA